MNNSINCEYSITGSGPALIMIHGIGANRSVWNSIVSHLAEYFTCITYDLRGHGTSPLPTVAFTLNDLVEDLHTLQNTLDINKAHIIGHSLGGMIGPAYARKYPDRVLSLGLLSTAAYRSPEDSARVQAVVAKMRHEGIRETIDVLTARWFTNEFAASNPSIIEQRKKQVLSTDADVFLNVFDIYATTEMSPWIHEIKQPSLVLTGELDGGCHPQLNQQIHHALPHSQLIILPAVKHAILLECPQKVSRALCRFYQELLQISINPLIH